jgi:hypothetical protein
VIDNSFIVPTCLEEPIVSSFTAINRSLGRGALELGSRQTRSARENLRIYATKLER